MTDPTDDLDRLLLDVRKIISDNRLFLDKLMDETVEDEIADESTAVQEEEEFEEL